MPLIATPKATNANAYVTEANATIFLNNERLYIDAWTNATTSQREAALIWSARLLDQYFEWVGSPRTTEQSMRWPRVGVLTTDYHNVDPDTIPHRIELANADFALALLQRDRVTEPELLGQGFSEASVGNLSVTVDPAMILSLIPRSIIIDLAGWGVPIDALDAGGMRTLKVSR